MIMAIESSGLVASAAYAEDGRLLGEYTVDYKKTHSQTLLPMLDALTDMLGIDPAAVDAIAVSAGPGSFTGLRIGSATAKGIGLALDKPIVEVPTVDALAFNLYDCSGIIVPMMDARREQVYTGIYRFHAHKMVALKKQWPSDVHALMDELNRIGVSVTFVGDGVPVYRDIIEKELRVPFSEAPAHLNRQRAGAVAVLGEQYFAEGKYVSADEHSPVYLRKTQAEREQAENGRRMAALEKTSERLRPSDYGAGDSYE